MAATRSPLTTHVLNTGLGTPAKGLIIKLYRLQSDASWQLVNEG